jgi:hypothetical protein
LVLAFGERFGALASSALSDTISHQQVSMIIHRPKPHLKEVTL